MLRGKKDFVERSKILLDTDMKIIFFVDHQNNFVGTLKIMSKNSDVLTTSLILLFRWFKIIFLICIQLKF